MLHVQLLGEVSVLRDGEPVTLSPPRRRLLAYLALRPGAHERDALASRFWPAAPDARANLRAALGTLRQVLGPGAVVAGRTTVALGEVRRDIEDLDVEATEVGDTAGGWVAAERGVAAVVIVGV